jgi:TPR repeat protein
VGIVDNISAGDRTGSGRLNHLGYIYKNEKKKYDKALAWYLLAAMENNSIAQSNIGALYYNGHGVPKNYLCALKWLLKATEGFSWLATCNHIGNLFGNGYGVPLNKYKALEWYCHGGDYANINRLKKQGYHRSAIDKGKLNYIIDVLY